MHTHVWTLHCAVVKMSLTCFALQYFQTLFCDGECFLHVVSLLHGNAEDEEGEKLVLNVLQTLTSLLMGNDASKVLASYGSFLSFLV